MNIIYPRNTRCFVVITSVTPENIGSIFKSFLILFWMCMATPLKSWSTAKFPKPLNNVQYIPRNMHTVFALLCFVVVIHWLLFPYPSGLLHWHCGNLTIAPVPAKQPWWIWIKTSCKFIINDCITITKQSTTKPCAYFLGYTVHRLAYIVRRGVAIRMVNVRHMKGSHILVV